jgi:16S rRNA (guanine527-N7)-methyltransferase
VTSAPQREALEMTRTRLVEVLERGRQLGFLGPGSVLVQIEHSQGFGRGVAQPPDAYVDLGSGGGVPGLALAVLWLQSNAVLLDASKRRCAFLHEAVESLGLVPRVSVVWARAEEAGRLAELRQGFDLVVARGFGPPAVTAECGAPFLRVGGSLIVSEPSARGAAAAGVARWSAAGLARVGLTLGESWETPYRYQALLQSRPCADEFPRRTGIPRKRPLF